MIATGTAPRNEARRALALLLVINLFCYLDRYILAAVIPEIKKEFLSGDPDANGHAGLLTTAFIFSYMLTAPIFGWLADRYSRWKIIAASVALWSLASGYTGFATGFVVLLCTRAFLGIGEAGYGPAAPTIISDFYPVEKRGQVLAWFFMAIPVGSALGYVLGGVIQHALGWRWAFFLVTPPGLLLAAICLFMPEPRDLKLVGTGEKKPHPKLSDYKKLFKIPSLITNILAQTAMTFAIGGLSVWAPTYIVEARGLPLKNVDVIFGGILVVSGLISTLLGGWLGDKLRARFSGSLFPRLWRRNAPRFPRHHRHALRAVPHGMDLHLLRDVFPLPQHRPVQYRACECDPSLHARHGLRLEYPRHPSAGRCPVASAHRLDQGPRLVEPRLLRGLHDHARRRHHLDRQHARPRKGHGSSDARGRAVERFGKT